MKLQFIQDAENEFHRLWSIRASIWLAVFTGVWTVISSANGVLDPHTLLWINVAVNGVVLPLLRVVDQTGGTNEQK